MKTEKPRSISFMLDWRDTCEGVACKTIAAINVLVNGTPVWPLSGELADDFEWYADEILAHLTECWKPILLRQTYPIPVQPERPSFLVAEAKRRWLGLSDSKVENEEREVAAFEDVHNLANAFGGITGLLPLWFVRDQDMMVIDTQAQCLRVPIQEAIDALVDVGNCIAERLLFADKVKWAKLVDAWKHRDEADGALLLSFVIGRDQATATRLINEGVLEAPTSVAEASNDNNELRIAARMAGSLSVKHVKSVLSKLRECGVREAPRLQSRALAASQFLKSNNLESARPYVQGNVLAKWLRTELNVADDRKIDPGRVLTELGVEVLFVDFEIPSLDAVAVWGPRHGPAVILNQTSERVRPSPRIWENGAIRVSAAHEICHFLVDSRHTLSAVDVLGGRMPLRIEQRAKAFAAEFLLPSNEAAAVWSRLGSPLEIDGVRLVITELCKKHNVTESLASWQLQHGVQSFNEEVLAPILDQIVPHR